MELFVRLGEEFTAQELYCWYHNAAKVVAKRQLAFQLELKDVRDASKQREFQYWQ